MKKMLSSCLAAGTALVAAQVAEAGTAPYFTPLTQSSAVASAGHVNELSSPWQTPAGISQVQVTSMNEIESDPSQSVVRVSSLGSVGSMWDMVTYDAAGEFIFIPHETQYGAGVSRYDIAADTTTALFSGDGGGATGDWSNDFGAFDPARMTPWGSLFVAEEWSGEGRVVEILNPYADPADIQIAEKHAFANVSVEGFDFSIAEPNVAYYVDEDNSGSIYKLVASDDTFDAGQTFVLSVDDFAGNPVANWNAADVRTGLATWVPITDADGNPLTPTDPFVVTPGNPRPGRLAANEVGGTPYGRPEDTAVARQRNGNEVLYFTATSENAVYSVEMLDAGRAIVRLFASEATTPKNVGFAGTTARLNSPDNLALDAVGNLYVIEDAPNGDVVGGDIWFARDADNDGVAESLDHFLSLQVNGAESTGMVFDPV
ncbi:MAG: DUF839 domain-containing protein, partial [Myxococcota bacterium]